MWAVRPPTVPRYLGQGRQKEGEERIIEIISKNIIQDSDQIYCQTYIPMRKIENISLRIKRWISAREKKGIKGAAIKGVAWLVLAPWKESVLDIGRGGGGGGGGG